MPKMKLDYLFRSFLKRSLDDLTDYLACVSNLDLLVQSVLLEESSWPQNIPISTVLKASKSAGAKGDVPKI